MTCHLAAQLHRLPTIDTSGNNSAENSEHGRRKRLAKIKVDRTQVKPRVAIIGEFWAMTTEGDGNYKMHRYKKTNTVLLYDLDKDIGEKTNIAEKHPDQMKKLEAMRVKWDSELIEPRFLGLTHTKEWQEKIRRRKAAAERKKKQKVKK